MLAAFLVGLSAWTLFAALGSVGGDGSVPASDTRAQAFVNLPSMPPPTASAARPPFEEQHTDADAQAEAAPPPQIVTIPVSTNHLLVVSGNVLYLMNAGGVVEWTWLPPGDRSDSAFFTDRPIVLGDTIVVVGIDLTHVALDAATGRVKWSSHACGRGVFTQIEKYKDDQYIVRTDMSAYHEGDQWVGGIDVISVFNRNHEILWSADFPRYATLKVWEGRIYAIQDEGHGAILEQIRPPTDSR